MKKLIILTLIFSLLLSGCANIITNNKSEYRLVYSGELTTLNYLVTSSSNEFGLVANLVDTLIDYDSYGVPKPGLSTQWSVSDDNLVWTFKLREGVKWYTHDLKEYAEVTAQDFVDAMKYILDPSNESRTANIAYGVLKNAENYIRENGGAKVMLSGQMRVSEFYKKQGYKTQGDIYMDQDCPHIWMQKEL